MKIAITSTGADLNAQVDPRFGRCAFFLFVDSDTLKFEAVENPNISVGGGAGIQSAQLVANKGMQVILTGSCGPNAFQTLQAAGVQVIVGVAGMVKDAIERYKKGELQTIAQSNVPSHFGMGMGMGRGMGRGMGYQQAPQAPMMPQAPIAPQAPGMGPGAPQPTKEQELQQLKQQTDLLKQQMEEINKRINDIEKQK